MNEYMLSAYYESFIRVHMQQINPAQIPFAMQGPPVLEFGNF